MLATGAASVPAAVALEVAAPPRLARGRLQASPGVVLAFLVAWALAMARLVDVSDDSQALVAVGAAYGAIVLLAAFFRPRWYLPLAVAYLPFSRVFPLPVAGLSGANLLNLLIAAGGLAWLTSHAERAPRARLGAIELLALLFVLVASASVLPAAIVGSRSRDGLLLTYRNWLGPILFFFLARGVTRDRRDVEGVLRVLAWTVFLVAACTWKEGIERSDRGSIDAARVSGLMEQANSMGAFLSYYGAPLLAFAATARRRAGSLAYLAGFALAARTVLFTFSRGAYLAFGTASGAILLISNPLVLVATLGGGLASAVLYPPLLPESVRERLGGLSLEAPMDPWADASTNLDRSAAHRMVLWRGAARIIAEYPLQGVGLGHFPAVIDLYTPEILEDSDPRDAHNAYLLIASEMGIPTLLLLFVFLLWLGGSGLRLYVRRANALDRRLGLVVLGMVGSVLVSCMLGSRFSEEALIAYFWILAAQLAVVQGTPEPRRRPARAT